MKAWRAVGFYGLILVFLPTLIFNFGLAKDLKRRIRKRDAKERTKEEEEIERRRLEWERSEEEKRVRRGEGVPGIGMDIETMMEEEKSLADKGEQKKD